MKLNKYVFLVISILLVTLSIGCSESVIEASTEDLEETFIGNSLALVELKTLSTANSLVPQSRSKAYEVDKRVGIEGDYYIFNIYTPHGTYLVKGVAALVEYAASAQILEMILGSNYGENIAPVMEAAVTFDNPEVLDIKSFKVDSIKGLGRRFNEIYIEDVYETRIVEHINDRDTVNGGSYNFERMTLAGKLGLDGYSASIYVQKFLDSMLTLSEEDLSVFKDVALVYPQVDLGLNRVNIDASMQSTELEGGGRSLVLEQKLIQIPPAELRRQIYNAFLKMFEKFDISDTLIGKLVESPYYSTREILYLFSYLNDMDNVLGRKDAINFLAEAENAFTAKINFLQLQLMHAYYVGSGGLRRLVALSDMLGMIDLSGQFVVIPVWDHTRDRNAVKKLLLEVKNLRDKYEILQSGIWFAGDCDKNTIKTGNKIGIQVKKSIVLEPIFRFTAFRKLSYSFQTGDPLVRNAVSLTPDSLQLHQRTNRPVPTQLLPENIEINAGKKDNKSTITIETPDNSIKKGHDPRNLTEFGIGVKIIPKEEWDANISTAQDGLDSDVEVDADFSETGSPTGRLPTSGEPPIRESVFD